MAQLASRWARTALKQGDIFFADLEPTVGREQRGRRPVSVISPDELNEQTQAPVVLHVTNGGGSAIRLGLDVSLPASMRTTEIVRCDQPRTVDLSKRDAQYIEAVPSAFLKVVLRRFVSIPDPDPEDA